jgi:hypothetical protein
MKKATQRFPRGWDEKKVQAVIDYYEKQTDQEGATEIEFAPESSGEIWMSVPANMAPEILRLIEARKVQKRPSKSKARQNRA